MTGSTSYDLDLAARRTVLHITLILVCLFNDTVSSAGYIPFRQKPSGESQYLEQPTFLNNAEFEAT
jgi:hypothetical protein